jgi:hypothetical protein
LSETERKIRAANVVEFADNEYARLEGVAVAAVII